MSPAPLLGIEGLSVDYRTAASPVAALRRVDLDIAAGERLAVLGESGSGKSTLALAIAGLLPASALQAGRIAWPGLARPPRPGADIGVVFQDPSASLDPVLPVGEQVAEAAVAHLGLSWTAAFGEAEELLARVGIPDPPGACRAFAHQFSGGQCQRIAIAMAIAGRPRLLIADEATSALDTIVQAGIVALVNRLVREEGMTLLFISHDVALVSGFADRIAVMRRGSIVESGPAAELLGRPRHAYTQGLIAAHIGLDVVPRRRLHVPPPLEEPGA
jgi:peptide/nickel transport system ATP-binding protein